jgi:hypothetical protein
MAGAMMSHAGIVGPFCTGTTPIMSTGRCRASRRRDHHRPVTAHFGEFLLPLRVGAVFLHGINRGLRQHDEEPGVNRIHTLARDRPLATIFEKRIGLLKVVALDRRSEGLRRFERRAVLCINVAIRPSAHRHQRRAMNAILPRHETEMQPASQHRLCMPPRHRRR